MHDDINDVHCNVNVANASTFMFATVSETLRTGVSSATTMQCTLLDRSVKQDSIVDINRIVFTFDIYMK